MGTGIRLAAVGLACAAAALVLLTTCDSSGETSAPLPKPSGKGKMSLEEALAARRSIRRFRAGKLTRQQIAQLCWAAQGISEPRRGFRTSPSAGALYPLELYVVTADGVDHYLPGQHALQRHLGGDVRRKLQDAALGQRFVGEAPATFVIAAVVARTQRRYGRRAERYVHMEVGHAGQNLLLQATALGLGAVPVGAFRDEEVAKALSLPKDQDPLYLIPVGTPAE
jgi:SagB-type dehydrogenase family enzyme